MFGKFISKTETKNNFKVSGNDSDTVINFTYDIYTKTFNKGSEESVAFDSSLDKFIYYDGKIIVKRNSNNVIEIYNETDNSLLASINGFDYSDKFYVKTSQLIFQINNKTIKVLDLSDILNPEGADEFIQINLLEGNDANELYYGYNISSYNNLIAIGSCAKKVSIINKDLGYENITQQIENAVATDEFGFSVALNSSYLAIGAPFYSGTDREEGRVYIYENQSNTFVLSQTIEINEMGLNLGYEISINENYLFIYAKSRKTFSSGKVYIYVLETGVWNFLQVLSSGVESDDFGYKIESDENFLIISSVKSEISSVWENRGKVSIYTLNDTSGFWELLQYFEGEVNGNQFGCDVAIENDKLLIGAKKYNNKGAFYFYEYVVDTWVLNQRFDEVDSSVGDDFGYAVSINC